MNELSWVREPGTTYGPTLIQGREIFTDSNTIDSPQFVHFALTDADSTVMFSYLKPVLHMLSDRLSLKFKNVYRTKVNHLSPMPGFVDGNYNVPHCDYIDANMLSIIYYVNDCDGDTFMFNEQAHHGIQLENLSVSQRITPKAGRFVVFPSNLFHASSNPINSTSRYVINFAVGI